MTNRCRVAIPLGILIMALPGNRSATAASAGRQQRAPEVGRPAVRLAVLPPGLHTQLLRREDGLAVHYAIAVPPNYSDRARAPLVLALHFGVGDQSLDAGRALIALLVGPALRELGALIVAPDSLGGGWETAQNEQAVMLLLDAVLNSYSVDPKKVVVTGFSMGGSGTWHYATKYPDRFSAAIPVAGRPPAAAGAWRLPVFAVHSPNDTVVPLGPTEARIGELKRMGVNAELVVLDGVTHFQTSRYARGLEKAVPWLKEIWSK